MNGSARKSVLDQVFAKLQQEQISAHQNRSFRIGLDLGAKCGRWSTISLKRLQILDDLHAFFVRQLAPDDAFSLWAVIEFVAGV